MKFKLKIWQFTSAIWLLIILLQFTRLTELAVLWFKYFSLLFNDFDGALTLLDFKFIDSLLSLIIFILTPLMLIVYHRRIRFLNHNLNFSSGVIIILLITFLMAQIITRGNPDFQKNLSVTKHLSPLSKVKVLHLKIEDSSEGNSLNKFLLYKRKILREVFNESIIYADSTGAITSDKILYNQKNIMKEIPADKMIKDNGEPLVTTKTFLLGTDEFGRDTFTRLVYGLRISLLVGIGAVFISFLLGITLGFIAGYKGGLIDMVLNRFAELLLAFPVIYLVVLILALFSSSLFAVVIVLGISGWMSLFKIVRGEVNSLKQKDYIQTSKLLGIKTNKILFKEILPVIIAPVIVNLIFQFSNVILAESALSYLGLGAADSYPSWGAMIQSGQEYITKAWWMIIFPGGCLVVTLFSANYFGRRLNKFFNPRLDI